jgi:hypothetical protein
MQDIYDKRSHKEKARTDRPGPVIFRYQLIRLILALHIFPTPPQATPGRILYAGPPGRHGL